MRLPVHLAIAFLATVTSLVLAQPQPGGDPGPAAVRQAGKLARHRPVERELGAGQTDVFTVNVAAGQFLHVLVEQKGVDVVVVLADPDGKPLVTADSPNGAFGPEPASLVAGKSGPYQVQVAKALRSSETGRYRIELKDLHRPRRKDGTRLQAETEFFAAVADGRAQDKQKLLQAIDGFERAAALWSSLHDNRETGLALNRIGVIYDDLGDREKAMDYYKRGLALRHAARDHAGEAGSLHNIGGVYSEQGNMQKALDYYNRALTLRRASGDRAGEAGTLNNIGIVYRNLGENQKALDYYVQILPLERATANRASEALTLSNIGNVYSDLGEPQKALDYYNRALTPQRALGDRVGEARTLSNMGSLYWALGGSQKALDYFNQALLLQRAAGDRTDEAFTLNNLGDLYRNLGDYQRALDYHNQALPIRRAVGDRAGEATTLKNIGLAYSYLGQNDTALDYHNRALPLFRDVGDREGEAATLNNIGIVYQDQKEYAKALDCFNRALPLQRAVGDRAGEASTLNNVGLVYMDRGENAKALQPFLQALQLARAVSDSALQGDILNNLMEYWQAEHNPNLAIFFGKLAVNQYQDIRRGNQGLEQQLQQRYLATVTGHYRVLADLLIAQGRLSEAEQVVGLLKEQEFFDYVRRDAAEASSVNGRANLSQDEADSERRYREIGDKLAAIGTERGDLLAKPKLTPEEAKRLEQLEKDVAVGNVQFEKFLGNLAQQFSAKPAAALQVEQLRETQGIMEDLRELPPGTVAIYTLAGEDKFRAILRTADIQKAYEYPIKRADLNRKVLDFREVVQNPKLDPRPLAEELYRIVIGPMAEDLRQAKAQTLMWSLDGVLRYVPLAALYDGREYLIEQYRVSVMTLASNTRLKDPPSVHWRAAGFGVTKAYEGAPALPSVSAELAGIVAPNPGDGGVLAGEIRLDGDFTQQTMRQALLKRYQVVHIATHFRFQPGNETQSFLLLGDGAHLSLAELKSSANLFGGVQLLTLSACNTGMGDGAEVEGFGTLAQRQGAKAVIASLWPVADASTSRLMQEFYRIRESAAGMTKLEALREAQLELLRGAGKAGSPEGASRGVVRPELENGAPKSQAPLFPYDSKAPFAHPYYWAPFFLMGNWL
jgi:CHAT domain-containing protein/Tfp pilus assembly protein PilF